MLTAVNDPFGHAPRKASAVAGLEGFKDKKYLSLETYRKSGVGVRTPVWFAAAPEEASDPKLYVYSTADSGKAKRIRRSGTVKIAPCDARGKVTGPWIEARAVIVDGKEFECGMRLLDRKYWPWKQLLNLTSRLSSRRQRVMIAIRAG
jgi:PPOX class probable F420-dependent enzyme